MQEHKRVKQVSFVRGWLSVSTRLNTDSEKTFSCLYSSGAWVREGKWGCFSIPAHINHLFQKSTPLSQRNTHKRHTWGSWKQWSCCQSPHGLVLGTQTDNPCKVLIKWESACKSVFTCTRVLTSLPTTNDSRPRATTDATSPDLIHLSYQNNTSGSLHVWYNNFQQWTMSELPWVWC